MQVRLVLYHLIYPSYILSLLLFYVMYCVCLCYSNIADQCKAIVADNELTDVIEVKIHYIIMLHYIAGHFAHHTLYTYSMPHTILFIIYYIVHYTILHYICHIQVIKEKMEDVVLPVQYVDIIISEWMVSMIQYSIQYSIVQHCIKQSVCRVYSIMYTLAFCILQHFI